MATSTTHRDQLDEVIAELERARNEPDWVPPQPTPRRLLRAPQGLAEARWRPSRQATVALVLIALCAVAIFGVRILLARDTPSPTAAPTLKPATAASASLAPAAAASVPAPPTTVATSASGVVYVHVVGQVKRPGVVSLKPGARVADAVKAAGGLSTSADLAAVNLARAVSDGEQIYVPKPGEKHQPQAPDAPAAPAASGGTNGDAGAASAAQSNAGQASPGASSASGGSGGTVNLNTADLAALDALPGVGPVLAQRILDWRTEHGKFSSVEELNEVSGIGDKAMERLRSKVTV